MMGRLTAEQRQTLTIINELRADWNQMAIDIYNQYRRMPPSKQPEFLDQVLTELHEFFHELT